MRLGLWDKATIASVVTVAIVEAVNETLKLEPRMASSFPFITFPVWHFVPLMLLMFAGLVMLARSIGLIVPLSARLPPINRRAAQALPPVAATVHVQNPPHASAETSSH